MLILLKSNKIKEGAVLVHNYSKICILSETGLLSSNNGHFIPSRIKPIQRPRNAGFFMPKINIRLAAAVGQSGMYRVNEILQL